MAEIISFSSTSSGSRGYSRQKDWLGCGALAAVNEKQKLEDDAAGIVYGPFPEEGKPVAPLVGSIFGELAQRYHQGNPVAPAALFHWDGESIEKSHPLSCNQARTTFERYAKKTAPDAFGHVHGVEIRVRIPEELFGNELTGAIDAVTEDARGIWITDWKTEGRNDTWLRDKYSLFHQNWLYALAYELETGVKPVGVRYVVVTKTEKCDVHNFEFDGVTEQRFKWLQRFFETVARKRALPIAEPSLSNCIQYNKPCKFLVNNLCGLL